MNEKDIIVRNGDGEEVATSFGALEWRMAAATHPGAEMVLGICTIEPGKRNPLHSHPEQEEILFVLEGECEHRMGDETYRLGKGDAIRIPRGVRHWAKNTGSGTLTALIVFSSGVRTAVNHEDEGVA
jgi:quercetin dioxygenase-like cupin family protein